jgi:diguanylate cyclase (GGDEF)-like protein/PAS domain S-box-containing protein
MKIVRSGGKVIFGSNVIPLTTKVSKSTINSFQQKTNVTKIADKNSKEKIIGSSPISITMGTDNINFGGSYESIDHIKGNKGENWQVLLLVNEEEVLKDFNQVNIMFIYTGLIFTIITALIAFVIGDKLARPLRYIASIAKSIGEGNFKKRVNLKRNDEISYLGKSLNQMANKLQKTMISKTRLETILETIQDGYWVVNLKDEIIEVNRAYLDISGYSEKELIGMKVAEIDAKKNEEEFNNHLEKVKKSGHHFFETKHETKEGKIINVEVSVSFLNTKEPIFVVFIRDITERKKEEKMIRYLSFHDEMTGLYNRRYFQNEMERLKNSRKLPISVIIGDMDGLKYINDNYGHQMGDKYIKKVGKILKSITRKEDVVARIGGDEFAILLPETTSNSANQLCERIQNKAKKVELQEPLQISLGYATMIKVNQDLHNIFDKADQNMYKNKKLKR